MIFTWLLTTTLTKIFVLAKYVCQLYGQMWSNNGKDNRYNSFYNMNSYSIYFFVVNKWYWPIIWWKTIYYSVCREAWKLDKSSICIYFTSQWVKIKHIYILQTVTTNDAFGVYFLERIFPCTNINVSTRNVVWNFLQ